MEEEFVEVIECEELCCRVAEMVDSAIPSPGSSECTSITVDAGCSRIPVRCSSLSEIFVSGKEEEDRCSWRPRPNGEGGGGEGWK